MPDGAARVTASKAAADALYNAEWVRGSSAPIHQQGYGPRPGPWPGLPSLRRPCAPIPVSLWTDLKISGLLPTDAPTAA
jgi:hypothetical protein